MAVFCLRREAGGGPRIGLTLPRALGAAVTRNRIRRRVRECARLQMGAMAAAWDIVIHPRRSAMSAPFDELRRELAKVFDRCVTC